MITKERFIEIFHDDNIEVDISNIADNAMEGLLIMKRWLPLDTLICGANHDIIYGPGVTELLDSGITEEDALQLRKMNWHLEDDDYLACFV